MKIRLWKLGNSEQKIYPSHTAFNKFEEILNNLQKNEFNDIIWDDNITVQEIDVNQEDLDVLLKATDSGYEAKVVLFKK